MTAAWVYLVAGLAAVVLVLAASGRGLVITLVAVGVAGFAAVVAVLGPERTGILLLVAGYFTAPFYKGTAPSLGSPVTATDLLLFVGFALLLPQITVGRIRLPTLYWAGIVLVLLAGLISSAASVDPLESYLGLTFWMVVMLGLPVAFAAWGPSLKVVDLLASAYIAGQVFSFFAGWIQGNIGQNRHAGLSTHPNYLAQASLLSIALLIYLAYRYFGRSVLGSAAILAAGVVCSGALVLSGSRAATVVAAVLVLMVPVVERSAVTGLLLGALGALFLVGLPIVADIAGKGSSLNRLAGGGGAGKATSARTLGLDEGLDRFFAHPILGNGLIELFDIHNNFLEVAVAIGVFGLAGYLMVLYVFARPILAKGDLRRLTYGVWAYIGFGATVPSLYDRSVWAVVALSTVAVLQYWSPERRPKQSDARDENSDVRSLVSAPTTTRT